MPSRNQGGQPAGTCRANGWLADGTLCSSLAGTVLAKEGAEPVRVGPLLILPAEEVEQLEALALRHDWRQALEGYAASACENPKDRAGSFRSFLYNRDYQRDPQAGPSFVESAFTSALEPAGEELTRRQTDAAEGPSGPQSELLEGAGGPPA